MTRSKLLTVGIALVLAGATLDWLARAAETLRIVSSGLEGGLLVNMYLLAGAFAAIPIAALTLAAAWHLLADPTESLARWWPIFGRTFAVVGVIFAVVWIITTVTFLFVHPAGTRLTATGVLATILGVIPVLLADLAVFRLTGAVSAKAPLEPAT